jgi:hypothetical protein
VYGGIRSPAQPSPEAEESYSQSGALDQEMPQGSFDVS